MPPSGLRRAMPAVRPAAVLLLPLVLLGMVACAVGPAGSGSGPAVPPTAPGVRTAASPASAGVVGADPGASADRQVVVMDDITAAFEQGKVVPQYGFILNEHDGCGYTAGWIGFCTADGDLLSVVEAYNTVAPANPLRRYTAVLERLADAKSEETGALGGRFEADWRRAADDPVFHRIQLQVGHDSYLTPAREIARREGITTALGLANLFDTALMMGPGPGDCDGVVKLAAETDKAMGGSPATGVPETAWLRRYNTLRLGHLRHPCTPGRQANWSRATGRVQALQALAEAGNWKLDLPLHIGGDYGLTITTAAD